MSSRHIKLIKLARNFDQAALAEIYDQFSDALYKYAYKQVGDSQVAEDLVSEAFNRFLSALAPIKTISLKIAAKYILVSSRIL